MSEGVQDQGHHLWSPSGHSRRVAARDHTIQALRHFRHQCYFRCDRTGRVVLSAINKPGEITSLSGLQELLHFCSNLVVVGAKPHQMTLSLRNEELSLRNMLLYIDSM
jgi:hypothetical protein